MSFYCINVDPLQIVIAEVESANGHILTHLSVERDARHLGNIYRGRIANVLPGMDAAFVDIGTGRNALLYFADLMSTGISAEGRFAGDGLRVGQERIVQITRPAVGSKGARVSERLSLAGRFLVMMAGTENIGVSKRIKSKQERDRLRRIIERLRPLDFGVIVRTEAEAASETQLAADLASLRSRFDDIASYPRTGAPPQCLYREMGNLERLVRDDLNERVSAIWIDDAEEFSALQRVTQRLAPQFGPRIQLYSGSEPIFRHFGLDSQIALASERIVPLASGGHLTFDEAEALTAIDVNTGRFVGKNRLADTVVKTNLEAVDEAARQMRLRNIGGIVVIDFIDMDNTRDRVKVMNALEVALKRDRTHTRIVQLSPLGLVEMTRRREGDTLRQLLHDPCPYCDGEGIVKSALTVSIEARHQVRDFLRKMQPTGVVSACLIAVHPAVALALIHENLEALQKLESDFQITLFLNADAALHRETVQISSVPLLKTATQHQESFHPGARLQLASPSSCWFSVAGEAMFIIDNFIVFNEWAKTPEMLDDAALMLEITEATTFFAKARVLAPSPQNQ